MTSFDNSNCATQHAGVVRTESLIDSIKHVLKAFSGMQQISASQSAVQRLRATANRYHRSMTILSHDVTATDNVPTAQSIHNERFGYSAGRNYRMRALNPG